MQSVIASKSDPLKVKKKRKLCRGAYEYTKEDLEKWIRSKELFIVLSRDGSNTKFEQFLAVSVDVEVLFKEKPEHDRFRDMEGSSASILQTIVETAISPEKTDYIICQRCQRLYLHTGGHIGRHVKSCYTKEPENVEPDMHGHGSASAAAATEEDGTWFMYSSSTSSALSAEADSRKSKSIQRPISDFTRHVSIPQGRVIAAQEEIARFLLKSGNSFNSLGGVHFQNMVSGVVNAICPGMPKDVVFKRLPGRTTLRNRVEDLAIDVWEKSSELVRSLVRSNLGFVPVVVDHGKVADCHLSVSVSLLDDRSGSWKMKLLPIAFKKVDSKTAEQTLCDIDTVLEKIGLGARYHDKVVLVADGASSMKVAGGICYSYIRCVNHSINLLAKRTFEPYSKTTELIPSDLVSLKSLRMLVKDCCELCSMAHQNRKMLSAMRKAPRKFAETRWLSELSCVEDVVEQLPDFMDISSQPFCTPGCRELIRRCSLAITKLRSIILVLGSLQEANEKFQARSVSLHMVAVIYGKLRSAFEKGQAGVFDVFGDDSLKSLGFDDSSAQLLAKSALCAVNVLWSEFSEFHFASNLLSPRYRDMAFLNDAEKKLARDLVLKLTSMADDYLKEQKGDQNANLNPDPSLQTDDAASSSAGAAASSSSNLNAKPKAKSLLFSDEDQPVDEGDDESPEQEMLRFLAFRLKSKENKSYEPGEFWPLHREQFPRLYLAARVIFSVIPSEAEAERAFSVSGRVVTNSRNRLKSDTIDWLITTTHVASAFPEILDPNYDCHYSNSNHVSQTDRDRDVKVVTSSSTSTSTS